MALSDILAKLLGANKQPDETAGTALAGNVFTPGVEQLLSAIPLLVGSYESGRGRPIGGPLEALGQMGMTNAANRQTKHQDESDVAARIESLANRGLGPTQGAQVLSPAQSQQLDAVSHMTAPAADKELSDIESQQLEQQKTAQAEQRQPPHIWTDKAGKVSIWDPNTRQMVRHPEMDSTKPASLPHSSIGVQDQLNTMGITGRPTPAQYARALEQSGVTTAQRAGASTVAKVQALDTLPIGYSDPTANVYAVGPSGYTRVYAKDPAASWEGLRNGKLVIVQGTDRQQFAYSQAAIKMLGDYGKMVMANKGYIPPNVDLQSVLGQTARRVVGAIDPESAADVTTASAFLADLIKKSFTNRTTASQLKLVQDAINSPHGTKVSDTKAISTAIQLLHDNEQTLIQHGITESVGRKGALAKGGTDEGTPEEGTPSTDSDPKPDEDDSGWSDLK